MVRHASARLPPNQGSIFADISRLAVEHGAVNLGQGAPDFPAPAFVKEAARAAISADLNQYAIATGQPRFRRAVAATFKARYGVDVDPESEIVVGSGAQELVFDSIHAFADPGDEMIVFEPFFDTYKTCADIAGVKVKAIRMEPPEWKIDLEALRAAITPRTRMILLNTPHNPTGKVFSREELTAIANLAIEHDLVVVSDEVYDRLVYDGAEHIAIATLPGMWQRTVTLNSTGKTFSLTGWKIGFAIAPAELIRAIHTVHLIVTFSSATPLQEGLATAFEQAPGLGYYQQLNAEYAERRRMLIEILENAGLPVLPSAGSFFLMADLRHTGCASDAEFCRWLIEARGVAAIPPSAFYLEPTTAPLLARFCFAKTHETLKEAGRRLVDLRKR
jgi:aspartate/methionine/tyrosine aminotransferase